MSGKAIQIRNLRRVFGDRVALAGIDLEIPAGVIFGLLGPNGGGKSTLFRILSTLLRPSSGTVSVFDADVVWEPAKVRPLLGVVFQAPSLDKKLTVFENMRCQGNLYGMHGAAMDGRIQELMERFGLSDRAHDHVETLSGGLARRVEIAKGMMHQPKILLLDEPSTGLDPGARRNMWQQLEAIHRQDDVTILLTTHIMEEADRCHDLALLHQGALVARGTPGQLKAEIPGGVIHVESREPDALASEIRARFDTAVQPVEGGIHMEHPDAHAFVLKLAEAYGDRIDSMTVGKPTLEDVFLRKTGQHIYRDP